MLRCRQQVVGRNLMRVFQHSRCIVSKSAHDIKVNKYLGNRDVDGAITFLKERSSKLPIEYSTFAHLISECGKLNRPQEIVDIFQEMESCGMPAAGRVMFRTVSAFNDVVTNKLKVNEIQSALSTFQSMKTINIQPDLKTYEKLMAALVKARQSREVISLFKDIEKEGYPHSVQTYNCAIVAYGRLRRPQDAKLLFDQMESRKISADKFTYGSLMSALEKGKKWEEALELLARMKKCKVPLNVVTYSAAVSACEKSGQWAEALKLIADMKNQKVRVIDCFSFPPAVPCTLSLEYYTPLSLEHFSPCATLHR